MLGFKIEECRIHGPVSVRPVIERIPKQSWRYMMMGPTGAGKSTFIEALAGDSHGLNISGDQLGSVTQTIAAYQLINVTRYGVPVYIIDTPGFSDCKISQQEIIDMVTKWMKDNDFGYIDQILYMMPTNGTRLEGTKRRTIELMRELLPWGYSQGITFVTTMWDQLTNERAELRAESNFAQLKDDILMDFIFQGAKLTKFTNTHSSAFESINATNGFSIAFRTRPTLLYRDLHERISAALQQKQMTEQELIHPTSTELELKAILEQNHADNEDMLVKFISQLRDYGTPPKGYKDAHTHLTAEIAALGDEIRCMEQRVIERRQHELLYKHIPQSDRAIDGQTEGERALEDQSKSGHALESQLKVDSEHAPEVHTTSARAIADQVDNEDGPSESVHAVEGNVEHAHEPEDRQPVREEKINFRQRIRNAKASIAGLLRRPTSALSRVYRSFLRRS